MRNGKASKTALRVAIRRAAHQLVDPPAVLVDPVAVQLIGTDYARDMERAQHTVARDFRAFLAARSRYTEDRLAEAVQAGMRQYVVLGAGLDTFAYRNPWPQLRVFEVDFPATQAWKRDLLEQKGIAEPENLTFAPLDFEHRTLPEGLREAGFDFSQSAYVSWLGVAPYLTREAFRATLAAVGALGAGSVLTFDFVFAPETLSPERQVIFARLHKKLLEAGEPMRLFLQPEELGAELERAGFQSFATVDAEQLNAQYFCDRADGLRLSPVRIGMLATARV
ncbi:class I SAM-dependent methyltransferase [Telmatobacter bradus]|uniref:class I SAM-dependent methyltransferase n=1 Tax=Telmatobacter bradus TaxID=474953 RepID=UPI003B439F28